MKDTLSNRRIPTLLAIAIIILGVAATSFLVRQGIIFEGRASPSQTPENIRITDITDTSFIISYTTDNQTIGLLKYGTTENLDNTALQDSLQSGNTSGTHTHIIRVKNLTPTTTYFFTVESNGESFLDKEKPFQVKTGPKLSKQPSPEIIKGNIIFSQNTVLEALVYVATPGFQTLATRASSDGSYTIDISTLRKSDLSTYISITETMTIKMLITNHLQTSTITLFANQGNPIPTIILSQNYDFTIQDQPVTNFETGGFPSFSASASAGKNPEILTPKKNDTFTDLQPAFRGTAIPNTDVEITINSEEEIKTTIKANAQGIWSFRPTTKLTPGEHTITIVTRDAFGILKTIKQPFTVFAQGSQVDQPATPSATIIPTVITPTVTPTPKPSASPSATPTTIIITPTNTPTPTISPSPTPSISAPSNGSIAPPGNTSAIIISSAGALIAFFGSLIFMLQRKML